MKKSFGSFSIVFILGVFVGLITRPYLPATVASPLPQPSPTTSQTDNRDLTPFPTQSIASPESQVQGASSETAIVKKVVDGDTIDLDNGEKVRYIGIDTPETKHPTKGVQCFGKKASEENVRLVEGKTVRLEKNVSERDRYGRLLRFVYVQTPQGELFVNDYLVRQGFAHAVTFPPDVTLKDRFREAETEARDANRGLWAECQ